jgi:hypothetical protein
VVELLAGDSIGEVCVMTGLNASLVHAVYAVYYRRPVVRRFHFLPLTSNLAMIRA